MCVAIGREIGGHSGEDARIERRIDDVAFVVGEQQLAGEPAREPPDRRLLGEPSEEPCGGAVSDVRFVSLCHGFSSREIWIPAGDSLPLRCRDFCSASIPRDHYSTARCTPPSAKSGAAGEGGGARSSRPASLAATPRSNATSDARASVPRGGVPIRCRHGGMRADRSTRFDSRRFDVSTFRRRDPTRR